MARVTVEDCLEKVPNRFDLVILSALRAKELLSGKSLLIEKTNNKSIVNSLREIAAGKVRFEEDLLKKTKKDDIQAVSEETENVVEFFDFDNYREEIEKASEIGN